MKNGLSTVVNQGARHRLDPARIIETAENLAREVGDRLPGSSLAGLAAELAHIARATDERVLALLGAALWFFVSFEARVKRKRVLESMEELREFIHVIDVTQLYYTPELYRSGGEAAEGSPKFDHTYLLFCTQMLAVIGNLAPLYTRGAAGDSILRAGTDVDMLANAITTKLQSKAEAVRAAASIS